MHQDDRHPPSFFIQRIDRLAVDGQTAKLWTLLGRKQDLPGRT
jgi:hypothetical protein